MIASTWRISPSRRKFWRAIESKIQSLKTTDGCITSSLKRGTSTFLELTQLLLTIRLIECACRTFWMRSSQSRPGFLKVLQDNGHKKQKKLTFQICLRCLEVKKQTRHRSAAVEALELCKLYQVLTHLNLNS
jgi:hypothetical protein